MKENHECSRNILGMDLPIYSNDKGREKTWYIMGHVVFYCPYCRINLKELTPTTE
jgi:hypothetical protein